MRRIILLGVALQVIFISIVCGQDDSSMVKQSPESIVNLADSVPSAPVKKKPLKVSTPKPDTIYVRKDSSGIALKDTVAAIVPYGSNIDQYIINHPYYNVSNSLVYMPSQRHASDNKDELFYIVCGILFFLGILRVGFPKYFQDIFSVFRSSTFRQKQIRDQLQQAGMTTLLFNIFFVFSAGIFSYLVIKYLKGGISQAWLLFAICFFSIALIYTGKYFVLKLTGWMFGQETAVDTYIFIVFLINKIASVLLIPFMLVLAFAEPVFQQIAFTTSIVMIAFLLIYRLILSYSGLRNELKISGLHLTLYVCGFEIIPVLLIYKLLLQLFERST